MGFAGWIRRDPHARSAARRLDELCEFAPAEGRASQSGREPSREGSQEELVFWFVNLVAWLRPSSDQTADLKLRYLQAQLTRHPEWRSKVSTALNILIARCDVHELLAYAGIPRDFHFLGALAAWASARLLPAACATNTAAEIVTLAFEEQDLPWFSLLAHHPWLIELVQPELRASLSDALSKATIDLAHQIVAQAHAPSVKSLSELSRSPFSGLYDAVLALNQAPDAAARAQAVGALNGRVKQCLSLLEAHRASLAERGADLNTTFQIVRLRQQLKRLLLLGALQQDPSPSQVALALVELVDACLQSDSGKRLIWGSADLVVQNVIDTAASVGRDYLDTVEASVWAAFRAGAWGGALMAIATAFKFLLASLHLPTLYEGLAFSLNYAATFCAAYLLHFTIATKLPAHTAAALARSVQAGGSHAARLQRFIEVWRTMVRLQLAGLVGNLVITVPLAFGIALAYRVLLGHDLLSPEKAQHVLSSHSLLGPSALYAALTGVMLWISSLVGSIVDNWARVVGLSERLATNVLAMKRFHIIRAQKRAQAMVSVVGGLSANVALGFMLGGVPALFAIAQLPVEIRHVTVSSGSVTMAWFSGGGSAREVALAVLGVLGIGVVNVTVSFWLALRLALRSTRGLRRESFANALVKLGIRRFWGRKRSRAEVAR